MKEFLKSLGAALWQRVVVAYKSTLIGIALVIADTIITQIDAAPIPQWAHAIVGVVAMLLALYRGKLPSVQTAAKAGVVLMLAGSLTACAATKRIGRATLDCAAPALVDQAKAFAPTLLDALLKPTTDWSQEVDHLVLAAGAAGICAMRAIVAEIESKPAPAVAWSASHLAGVPDSDELRLARAKRWLKANGVE